MKTDLKSFNKFYNSICSEDLVFMFGTGISSALTEKSFGWYKWIADGITSLSDIILARNLRKELDSDSSANNLINVAGKVIEVTKLEKTYSKWMHEAFEAVQVKNDILAQTLKKLTIFNDVFVTTNYDLLLEQATGLKSLSFQQPDQTIEMLKSGQLHSVLHIHGIYDSIHGIDNIIADSKQYESVLNDKGAQFIQNILGTRTLIFIGCGKTTEDLNIRQFVDFAPKYLKMTQDYYFLCNSSSSIDDLPENIHLIPYGDDYSDLPSFLEDIAQERIKHKIAKFSIIGRTAFEKYKESNDLFLKYHYSRRMIPFCGRNNELKKLHEFIESEDLFSWLAITGQAGAGKSRLAYEFISQLPSSWFGFFVHDNVTQNEINNYIPFCNSVVIIDYVAGKERQVADFIRFFNCNFKKTNYKLRIILLERDNERKTGSWYSMLLQRSTREDAEILKTYEYGNAFLNIGDLDSSSVIQFISLVCKSKNLDDNPSRDKELFNFYKQKFERLQFRPLFLQLFIEAWIDNNFTFPKYDDFTDLLENLLKKEQEKWLVSVDNNCEVCNACIRLLIRANIEPLIIEDIPDLYKNDWEILHNYVKSHSFIGKQKNELQDTFINSMCQNIDNCHSIIAPQFPDIIKEYMFCYYTDVCNLPDIMKEIWQHAAASFSIFITKCLMDFKDHAFFNQALNAYKASTTDIDVLEGRLDFLQNRLIKEGEDPEVLWRLIENEYVFWNSIVIPEKDDDDENEEEEKQDRIALLKVSGLSKVAQNIASLSIFDVSFLIHVIDEIVDIHGGLSTELMKKLILHDFINLLSISSFFEESKYLQDKLDKLTNISSKDKVNNLFLMHNYNAKLMNFIISDDFENAKNTLLLMGKSCNTEYLLSAQSFAHSCFNLETLSLQYYNLETIGIGLPFVIELEHIYPEDWSIRSWRIGCQSVSLQKQYFIDKINEETIKSELKKLENDLSTMTIEVDESKQPFGMIWSYVKTFRLNFASLPEILEIINDAQIILAKDNQLSEVVTTLIQSTRALHKKFLHVMIPHSEVENLFKYVEANPNSACIREEFFNMLKESEDANKKQNYITQDIARGAYQDAMYNPLMGSGIPEIDQQFDIIDEGEFASELHQYKRKIGRNEPCPCGSGKKFKKCCLDKGKYD